MTEEQINAIRVALEVLQQYGLIPNKPITPGTEAQALHTAATAIAEREVLAEVGHIILPFEREQELHRLLEATFLGKPNTFQTRAAAEVITQQFLSSLKRQDLLPEGRFFTVRLDEYNVHRVGPHSFPGIRTFVKVSFSKDKYNLRGNAHNYLLDYDWEMKPRSLSRNQPQTANTENK